MLRSSQGSQQRAGWRGAIGAGSLLALACAASRVVAAQSELVDLTLEELANIQITSVSKRAESLSDAAASVFVITAEDIRRAGAVTLPEALRLAPNLEVARVDASQYAISARGFNSTTANKLLVLIDGRTVYTPLFSGVFWDAQDVLLDDIERIEVISGPGATLWGANAVTGVINVITRAAKNSQGGMTKVVAGNGEDVAAARYGGRIEGGHYRFYGRFVDVASTLRADGSSAQDAWYKGQLGFRSDWSTGRSDFTLQGDAYDGRLGQSARGRGTLSGANLLGRWSRRFDDASQASIQAYYDRTRRNVPGVFGETLDTLDVEFQHALRPLAGQRLLWGAGHRRTQDRVSNSGVLAFLPPDRDLSWSSVFAQDEIPLHEKLKLTIGAKLERNPYSGTEVLPNVRIAWKLTPDRLLWSALTRAVRAPARIDREFFVPGEPPFLLAGGPNFRSEIANTLEAGYRAQTASRLSYSITTFYSRYDKLRSLEPGPAGALVIANKIEGSTRGIESWGSYQPTSSWRLSAGFVWLERRLRLAPDSADSLGVAAEGNDPERTWLLRSSFDFSERWEVDVIARRVSALPNPPVPAYTRLDVHTGWRANRNTELALTLQNLLDSQHPEFGDSRMRSEIRRSISAKWLWRF